MTGRETVLVVDDDGQIRRSLHTILRGDCYDVLEASSGEEALKALSDFAVDAVLLDLGLPDREGLDLVPMIRQLTTAAVLVLSARDAVDEKVTALSLGADDYIVKPFIAEELLARIRTGLRHRLNAQSARTKVVVEELEIDLVNHRVVKADKELRLTWNEYSVLSELAKHRGQVITYGQLMQYVRNREIEHRLNRLHSIVRNLRQKIERDPDRPSIVINELGVGYSLSG
ncbi:response regulator transcription factor [Acidisoma sp. L85]|uniref:response regulator transcription factor n=1 Tax=Acidisoma sp. L85 TaxID=1641850 RepID=UPI00131AD71E|nr:response regulator transcription factor [Acidisoma sp. L85]